MRMPRHQRQVSPVWGRVFDEYDSEDSKDGEYSAVGWKNSSPAMIQESRSISRTLSSCAPAVQARLDPALAVLYHFCYARKCDPYRDVRLLRESNSMHGPPIDTTLNREHCVEQTGLRSRSTN